MNLTCAAGILCGAESPGLPSPPQHKCMFCGDGLHGGICGRLYEEIVKDRSFVGLPDCLNDRAKGLTNSVGAIMCNLCIQTNLRQQDRTTSVTTKNNDMATNDASFIPNEASISGTSTTSTSRSDDTNSAQVLSADISLPEQIVPSIDADAVNKLFKEAFPVGKWYNSAGELFEAVSKWASQYHFTVRKDGARIIKCSRAENTHSKKKAAKAKTVQIKQYSLACSCPFYLRFSLKQVDKGRVCITEVNGYHNHTLDLRSAELSQRLAGRNIEGVLPIIAPHFLPHLKDGSDSLNITVARNIITYYLGESECTEYQDIISIVKAVAKYINEGKCKMPERVLTGNILRQFHSVEYADEASEKCNAILERMKSNSSGDMSWSVLTLLEDLKTSDPDEFDYRHHRDSAGNIDAFTWQTGVHRAAFHLYGDCIFLDARKNERMNELGMKYMTVLVIDANNQFWPISHTFVFREDHCLYEFACKATVEMTPGRTLESVKLGYGDMFFEPDRVKEWFPNILMMIDAYHLIYAENNKSILAVDFGGTVWPMLRDHFVRALEADTEEKFMVSALIFHIFSFHS